MTFVLTIVIVLLFISRERMMKSLVVFLSVDVSYGHDDRCDHSEILEVCGGLYSPAVFSSSGGG